MASLFFISVRNIDYYFDNATSCCGCLVDIHETYGRYKMHNALPLISSLTFEHSMA